jgi:hypothetical protein
MNDLQRLSGLVLLICLVTTMIGQSNGKVTRLLYETSFEEEEGYSTEADLIGQNGWIGFAGGDAFLEMSNDGSSGLLTDFLESKGQQAYIGFVKPEQETSVEFLSLLQPLGFEPAERGGELVRFTVAMGILDSTNGERDNFRWSIYNTEGFRLFSLDFDNETKAISYALDDAEPLQASGFEFDNETFYNLRLDIDFDANKWSAWASDVLLVEGLPVSTQNLKLDLSDIDAVWAIFKPEAPGDNFMVFDNYRIEIIEEAPSPPTLSPLGHLPNGGFVIRVQGEPNSIYKLESSFDLSEWQVAQNKIDLGATGSIDWVDDSGGSDSRKFYRLK